MRVVIVLALVGAALAAPQDHALLDSMLRSPRIVGGVEASIEEFPFMANLLYSSWRGTFDPLCGGSLIKPTAVLTAAHCLLNGLYPLSSFRVRVGSAFTESGGIILEVNEMISHPDYVSRLLKHDVAVVKLATSAELSEKVGIVIIALPDSVVPDNTLVTTIGFGVLSMDSFRSEVLQKVNVYTINHQLCTERYAYLKTIPGFENTLDITPDKMCAGILNIGGKDACNGDLGGPLLYNSTVVGIVSWAHDCAHPYFPRAYTRVALYSNWITENS